ncbi:FtsK/SpoIIIE domain-containing protein [Crossiella cryophila]|uniref:S-DNA-T family DNA segregation ATPase FtsK/SpoIIIE n=1 Tax=Crossiella cryophila TaxID=43355 RepID=A0A7W7FWQ6_9PSEU|nr:FtsK/SpoIIIE domain-containing protein [Crossiella cryophila]MBB4680542.1 S-DNA-T family DNA segregation ATPase FtsK/SpoIIIE [Crossiella cryophila]
MTRRELVRKVFDAEIVDEETVAPQCKEATAERSPAARVIRSAVRAVASHEAVVRARSVLAYRLRKAPRDLGRLVWFLVRGVGRWSGKAWRWASYADLRADARAARLSGDADARRTAQELIRADARARWAKLGIFLRRTVITAAVVIVLLVLLALLDLVADRAEMPGWLRAVYEVRDAIAAGVGVVRAWLPWLAVVGVIGAALWEGRDRSPGAGWLTRPDRDDADSWVDERMVSRALAHLGIAPLNAFLKNGGELVYTVAARKDGDGTYAQVRLPLGVTAAMVTDRRKVLAANLGRAALETWPTTGEEDGVLDLWVADKGTLSGGAGDWPLLHDGFVDVFDGVPFGLSQRGLVINAPLFESNWLVGGRPGQGKTNVLRVLMLGAALDPTAELWAYVMGESPDFEPLAPRLSRYRVGMDDSVPADAVRALEELLKEMERRGTVLGEQPGQPPKVSRRLADKPGLGLHPLIMSIDECHELFQHPRYGKQAADLAVRLIKRGRKYGIILLLATQSPTKDSIPKEITRNISCGVAFAVADHVANDGLLGAGKYRAGVRATELRMKTDRGTCVAVGVSDNAFELIRTFYVPFEDGADMVTPVVTRAMAHRAEHRPALSTHDIPREIEAAPVDHLADIDRVIGGEPRVRTQTVLARLAGHNPTEYEPWTARDLRSVLDEHGVPPRKSDGAMVVRADDVAEAITRRTDRDEAREPSGNQGVSPVPSLPPAPSPDQGEQSTGRRTGAACDTPEHPLEQGSADTVSGSLPDMDGGGGHGD